MIRAAAGALTAEVLRQTFSCFPSGVTALCALVDGEPVGMAASSFTSVSLDPPLVLVCVAEASATWARMRHSPRLGVSVLTSNHDMACRQLAAKQGDRFAGLHWSASEGGAVFLGGSAARFDCAVVEELPAGDHKIALLQILNVEADLDLPPLVFHLSRFHSLAVTVA
jgi:flavin reductase (DIM6/NTAB) family NADH-FMN oxidoreductase RutF